MLKDEIQFIINQTFQSDNLYENVHDLSLGNKTSLEKVETIDMVLHIHIKEKNVILEEDFN